MAANGILIVNKPPGKTSRWTTDRVSMLLREKKAGHLGTLDPIATGVLPVALGRATRLIRFLEKDDKTYSGVIKLGQATNTQDSTGEVTRTGEWKHLDPSLISAKVATFQGRITQLPPMHSAVKKDGRPLYKLARKGIEVEREPRKVRVFTAFVESMQLPDVTVRVRCEPGTYMRTIAHDLGVKLGCGAHLVSLTRLASGPFTIEETVNLEDINPEQARQRVIPLARCLPHFPSIELDREQVRTVHDGMAVPVSKGELNIEHGQRCRLLHKGKLIAVAQAKNHGRRALLRPLRVLE